MHRQRPLAEGRPCEHSDGRPSARQGERPPGDRPAGTSRLDFSLQKRETANFCFQPPGLRCFVTAASAEIPADCHCVRHLRSGSCGPSQAPRGRQPRPTSDRPSRERDPNAEPPS